jgi:hypothetical protein
VPTQHGVHRPTGAGVAEFESNEFEPSNRLDPDEYSDVHMTTSAQPHNVHNGMDIMNMHRMHVHGRDVPSALLRHARNQLSAARRVSFHYCTLTSSYSVLQGRRPAGALKLYLS